MQVPAYPAELNLLQIPDIFWRQLKPLEANVYLRTVSLLIWRSLRGCRFQIEQELKLGRSFRRRIGWRAEGSKEFRGRAHWTYGWHSKGCLSNVRRLIGGPLALRFSLLWR